MARTTTVAASDSSVLLRLPADLLPALDRLVTQQRDAYFITRTQHQQPSWALGGVSKQATQEELEKAKAMAAGGRPMSEVNQWLRLAVRRRLQAKGGPAAVRAAMRKPMPPSRTSVILQLLRTALLKPAVSVPSGGPQLVEEVASGN